MTVHESFLAVGVNRELPPRRAREVLVNVWRSSPIVVLLVGVVSHGGRLHLRVEYCFARRTAKGGGGGGPLNPLRTNNEDKKMTTNTCSSSHCCVIAGWHKPVSEEQWLKARGRPARVKRDPTRTFWGLTVQWLTPPKLPTIVPVAIYLGGGQKV